MTDPITIDIPHKLGRAGARARLEGGIGQIASAIPGGAMKSHRWQDDTLVFELEALGQKVQAELEVLDDRIHAVVILPAVASLFASTIRNTLSQVGTRLLR
ncbi:polyhydroxyalkanoic acid system family protein [Novosphingobium sp. JCM 18896]|uniref:polyhydroxyalkanoic acid system family protein n=1 Tax=Novosphingobium sp. JCM 18896 TaxID=2989731 RepID=UPI0022231F9E|nr:polyhydroxyalkanoic acid system family protein [Novosphingobium sp. JCM 18896]MCW1430280.1 polyhydroxyalkanoic acid system family protein [Novosphingobium sp. JCM 18896]